MKLIISFVSGLFTAVAITFALYSSGNLALVSHQEYSGRSWEYMSHGEIDIRCVATTYKMSGLQFHNITAYSVYSENQIAGGALISSYEGRRPVVMFWDDNGRSMNNMFQNLIPVIKKGIRENNTSATTCLGESKLDKSNWW